MGLVSEYLGHMQSRGLRERTLLTAKHALLGMFPKDMALGSITPALAERMYRERATDKLASTHQLGLSYARRLFVYAQRKGYVETNPFAEVEPLGNRNHGRDKLRLKVSEARALLDVCLSEPTESALATAIALTTGCRSSEVLFRVAGDVDDDGALLWVSGAKTTAGNRPLTILDPRIRQRLREQVRGRSPGEPLWQNPSRDWFGYHVGRLCKKAGVTEVSPHALRRTVATIAAINGVAAGVIARELGQGGGTKTLFADYLATGSVEAANTRSVTERLLAPRENGRTMGKNRSQTVSPSPDDHHSVPKRQQVQQTTCDDQ